MNEEDIIVVDNEDYGISEEVVSEDSIQNTEMLEVIGQDDLNLSETAGIGMLSVGVACMLSLGINQVLKMFRRA